MPVSAQAMTVADFLARANALKAKGMLAMLSPDLSVVRGEMNGAKSAYFAEADAARAKGRKDLGCPPAKGQPVISADIIMADLAAIPGPLKARTSVKSAVYAIMRKHYPCR